MFQIYYLITNACNLHCTHCIRGSQEYLQYMSFDDAIKGLDNGMLVFDKKEVSSVRLIEEWDDDTDETV